MAVKTRVAPRVLLLVLALMGGLQMIDPTVANIILVDAGRDLRFDPTMMALAASISTLALAATVLGSGVLADRVGRKGVLLTALAVAVAGDTLSALAPYSLVFIAGRGLAGVGLGAALAATFAYVRFIAPEGKVGKYVGTWNAIMLASLICGSLVGSFLAGLSWRWTMLLVPALAVCLLIIGALVLPKMPITRVGRTDYPGIAAIGLSTVALLFGISQATRSLSSSAFLIPTLAGLAGIGLFVLIEVKSANPAFPIRLFRQGVFVAAVLSAVAWNYAQAVAQLSTSNWWQYVAKVSTFQVALMQLPMLITTGIASVLVGRRLSKRGSNVRKSLPLGYAVLVTGFGATAVATVDGAVWWVVPGTIVIGLGLAFASVPTMLLFLSTAPKKFFGAVTAFRTTTGQIGFAIGLSLSVMLVQSFANLNFLKLMRDAGVEGNDFAQSLDFARIYFDAGEQPPGELAAQAFAAAGQAYTTGVDLTMLVSAGIILLLGGSAAILLQRSKLNI